MVMLQQVKDLVCRRKSADKYFNNDFEENISKRRALR